MGLGGQGNAEAERWAGAMRGPGGGQYPFADVALQELMANIRRNGPEDVLKRR